MYFEPTHHLVLDANTGPRPPCVFDKYIYKAPHITAPIVLKYIVSKQFYLNSLTHVTCVTSISEISGVSETNTKVHFFFFSPIHFIILKHLKVENCSY